MASFEALLAHQAAAADIDKAAMQPTKAESASRWVKISAATVGAGALFAVTGPSSKLCFAVCTRPAVAADVMYRHDASVALLLNSVLSVLAATRPCQEILTWIVRQACAYVRHPASRSSIQQAADGSSPNCTSVSQAVLRRLL